MLPASIFAQHSEQNLATGLSGFFAPHSEQNFPLLTVPQVQVQVSGAAVSAAVWESPDGETSPGPAGASVEGAAVDGAAVVSTPGPPLTVPESVSPGPPVPVLSPGT